MPPSVKDTFKQASHAFIRRDHVHCLSLVDEVFALLPAAPALAWAVDHPPKSRAQERWRNQAAALFLTASTVYYKQRRDDETQPSAEPRETEEELIDRLSARLSDVYRSSADTPHEPLIPPNLVATLAMSARSIGVSSSSIRARIESYLSSAQPAELIGDPLPAEPSSSDDGESRPWWLKEASEGYEQLMELYLVDVLAGGDDAGEGEREEAKRLLIWEAALASAAKQVSTAIPRVGCTKHTFQATPD